MSRDLTSRIRLAWAPHKRTKPVPPQSQRPCNCTVQLFDRQASHTPLTPPVRRVSSAMKTLCVLLVVLGAALAEKPCCYPDTFVSGKGTTVGYSRLWKKGAVHAVGMLAFDYPGQKAAEIVTMYEYPEERQLHVIYRYDQQKQYMIDMKTSKCYESPLLEKMENCVYANATFYGDSYLGNKQMNITNFGYFVKDKETEGQVSLSVVTEGCLPGSFVFVGRADGVDMTYISGFYDYVPSIENPGQYFDVPAACSAAGSKGSPPFFKPRLGVVV